MPTCKDIIDKAQEYLHDSGALWTRTELLEWLNDAYRQFLARSECVGRFTILDVPGRVSYAYMHEWESRYLAGGTGWKWSLSAQNGYYQCSAAWEVEFLDGVTPSTSLGGYTQPWERAYVGDSDRHFQFALPRNHERIKAVYWNHQRLEAITTKELDDTEQRWMRLAGEPGWWTPGVGRNRMFEIFAIRTDYQQGYQLVFNSRGLPRGFSGSRTYTPKVHTLTPLNGWGYTNSGESQAITRMSSKPETLAGFGWRWTYQATGTGTFAGTWFTTQPWEKDMLEGKATLSTGIVASSQQWEHQYGAAAVTLGIGNARQVLSPDRQYLPLDETNRNTPLGAAVDWRSSVNALLVWNSYVPPVPVLTEDDSPALIPVQMYKYLRYYVLALAFGRPGEGNQPEMAQHYEARFTRGVSLMRSLGDVARRDRMFVRGEVGREDRRPPRVRLPLAFPRVW